MLRGIPLIALLLVTFMYPVTTLAGLSPDSVLNPRADGGGYVSDVTHTLDMGTTDRVNKILRGLDEKKEAQIAVVILNTIGETVAKNFATDLFRSWKLGYKGLDNGILVLIVKDQHRIEIEVGYGLEGELPDIVTNHIQQRGMIPDLKKGDYNGAVLKGVELIREVVDKNRLQVARAPVYKAPKHEDNMAMLSLTICIANAIITYLYLMFSRGKSKFSRSSVLTKTAVIFTPLLCYILLFYTGVVQPGFIISLGAIYFTWGTFFGLYYKQIEHPGYWGDSNTTRQVQYSRLIVATNGLRNYTLFFPLPLLIFLYRKVQTKLQNLRFSPYQCTVCKHDMALITNARESSLTEGEIFAEKIGAVVYDVWKCPNDGSLTKVDFINADSQYFKCEKCENITALVTGVRVQQAADDRHEGYGYKHLLCQYCHATSEVRYLIPKIINGYVMANGSDDDNSSETSSSGSSDSWGGGSSGGGGSGSNW